MANEPLPRVFLRAEWRWLLMANYEIDPTVLEPYVPAGTELEYFDGRTFVSVVGFRFLNTRVLGLKVPFHVHFDEVNLRFYVRRQAPNGWRRGVVFIKEIVPRFCVALVARRLYNERYVTMPMRHELRVPQVEMPGQVSYRWKSCGRWHELIGDIAGAPRAAAAGSAEEFLIEHYWGYTSQRDGSTMEYLVEHPPWRIWPAQNIRFNCAVAKVYGDAFVTALSKRPACAFVADGSEVQLRRGRRIPLE